MFKRIIMMLLATTAIRKLTERRRGMGMRRGFGSRHDPFHLGGLFGRRRRIP